MVEENNKEKSDPLQHYLNGVFPEEAKTEKLEFLKREEIRTMEKDIRRLREAEAEKEKKRVLGLEIEEKTKEEEIEIKPETKPEPEVVEPELPPEIEPEPKIKPGAIPEPKVEPEKIPPPPPEITPEIPPAEPVPEQPEPKPIPEPKVEVEPELETQPEETLIPKPPARPHPWRKIFIRVMGISLLLTLLLAFNYWFLNRERLPAEDISPPAEEEEEPQPPIEEPEVTIPPSLISVAETKIFPISKIQEIIAIFNQLAETEFPRGSFVRIVIIQKEENRLITLGEIAQAFQINIPSQIASWAEIDDFTLLVYPQPEGNRGALILKREGISNFSPHFNDWEKSIEKDGLFISQNKIPTLSPTFKNYAFHQVPFRYLTISKTDTGVCYSLFENYFILTGSFGSMEQVIEELKEPAAPPSELIDKIGQLFIIGFQGKTVTPQLEDFFKKYKPGGVLLLSKNIESSTQLKSLTEQLQSLSLRETGLPLFIAVDQEGEPMSRIGFLSEKTAQSALVDTDGAYNVGFNRGKELKELGINLNLAPVLDDMQAGDFYFNRAFQKVPELAGQLARSIILGQKEAGILTAIKHFPGYAGVTFNPETSLAKISLPETSQFTKAAEAEPAMVMAANAIYQEIDSSLPLTFSAQGVQFLKSTLGSEILIISDDLAQNSLLQNFSLEEIMTKPIDAGIDMLIFSGWRTSVEQGLDTFWEAVLNQQISEQKINDIVSKIIQLKESL